MRHLIIAAITALTCSFPVVAAEESHAAGFQNNAGGMTIITDRSFYCGSRGMYDGYAFAADGRTARFCWITKNNAIMAVYEDGDIRTYHPDSFKLLAEEPEVNFNKP